jgi:hypothetical protein
MHASLVISPGSGIVRRNAQKSLSKNEQKILRYSTDDRSDDNFVPRAHCSARHGIQARLQRVLRNNNPARPVIDFASL